VDSGEVGPNHIEHWPSGVGYKVYSLDVNTRASGKMFKPGQLHGWWIDPGCAQPTSRDK